MCDIKGTWYRPAAQLAQTLRHVAAADQQLHATLLKAPGTGMLRTWHEHVAAAADQRLHATSVAAAAAAAAAAGTSTHAPA